ncbi:20584_t:CDS:2 [Funneliformis geosporum]|nr:20584_t:CDS:2 [Funneliformis geosporum]
MSVILQQCLTNKQPVYFMPIAVSDETEYINGVSTYILRVSVPEETLLPTFKTRLNHFDRYNALKIVCEVGISTASDDLNPTYYYRKVAREKRLPLSS